MGNGMKKTIRTAVFLLATACSCAAGELPGKDGSFRFGDAVFNLRCAWNGWKASARNRDWKESAERREGDTTIFSGFLPGLSGVSVAETVVPEKDGRTALRFELNAPSPVSFTAVYGELVLPASTRKIWIDGAALALPEEPAEQYPARNRRAKQVQIPLSDSRVLTVEGDLRITVQDNRLLKRNTFDLRFLAAPDTGNIQSASLALSFSVKPVEAREVDLSAAANLGFADDKAGDGKGGWTDQGPGCDLRALKPGSLATTPVAFQIADPARNGGRGAIVVAGRERSIPTRSVTLDLPENDAAAVNLLHATAWTGTLQEIGAVEVTYPNGTVESISVRDRFDSANWFRPYRFPNAELVWTQPGPEGPVALYASSFPLRKGKGPKRLVFRCTSPAAIWMIAGVTLSNVPADFAPNPPEKLEMKADDTWLPLAFTLDSSAGSVLDLSFLNDAPAGKYGRIIAAPDGSFTFEKAPEKRIRFYGTNLAWSANYLSKERAGKLAKELAACGYNAIRLHHMDEALVARDSKSSTALDPAGLDALDYLVWRLGESGIYVTVDFFTKRAFRSGDAGDLPALRGNVMAMKNLVPVDRNAMENWKTFTRNWMTHRNPYTGLTWAEDPRLMNVSLINEDPIEFTWNGQTSAAERELYCKAYLEYARKQGWKAEASDAVLGNRNFRRFLIEVKGESLAEQMRFVRDELGMKQLITSLNVHSSIPLMLLRNRFDLVDNHQYWAHPKWFRWPEILTLNQDSAISALAWLPRLMMPTRIFGKPFIVTEFNFCHPNRFRAEGGPLTAAYASLQDWDGLFRFSWAHDRDLKFGKVYWITFTTWNDPMQLLSDRIAALVFRRSDFKPAPKRYAYRIPENYFDTKLPFDFPDTFSNLGLVAGIGSVIGNGGEGVRPPVTVLDPADTVKPDQLRDRKIAELWNEANEKRIARSMTGELLLDAGKREFTAVSPRSELFILSQGALEGHRFRVENVDSPAVIAAVSLDGLDLDASRSVLLFHLTDTRYENERFFDASARTVENWGGPQLLLRKGSANIVCRTAQPFHVAALSAEGRVLGPVKVETAGGVCRFHADTAAGVMVYHLTR